ncbi:helix-turn-helix domain-containing protein [Achromobacter anxifer]|uniref:helix-turn-helix domain-containing protein n=1 Tax=Achromobacter anxifer TaxID=1287737 RepID=UPI00358ED37A
MATEPATKPALAIKPLSERQASCLHWAAMGKTSWETARILGVSESTVNFHLCNACDKLGVRGRRAAVVMAMKLGLIASLTA